MKNLTKCIIAALMLLAPALSWAQYTGEHFIMHASGLHLAKRTWSAILESPAAENPQKLNIQPTSDGYYNIIAGDGTFLAQNGSNEWNTGFVANGGGDVAKFSIEQDGNFIKFRNKRTNKYLGVDEVQDGNWVFCDKSGTSTTHMWFLSDFVDDTAPGSSFYVIVNPAAQRQVHEGWGVSLCWWAHMCGTWKEEKIDEIVEWLTSPEYLNYNIFRYNIGGGDDPEHRNCTEHHMAGGKGIRAEMPGYKAYENAEYDWEADSAQVKIMLKIKEKRPDAIFEAFSNSAPWWMTYSGCCSGNKTASNDNLKPEYYTAFANYLVDVCKHIKDEYGIEFRSLDPFNEPQANWWGCNGGQEGCHFGINSQIAFLKVLYPILQASGLNTVISASDENNIDHAVDAIKAYKQADVLKYLGQVNSHTYAGSLNSCSNLNALAGDAGLRLWMSEVGSSGDGIQGNLRMAQHLIRDMRYMQPAAWVDWQYVEEGYDQWCFVQAGFKSQNYRRVNNFYVRQHISKYIKQGYTILTSTNNSTLVARNPEGTELVIVVVNPEALECSFSIDLGFYKDIKEPTLAAYSTSNKYFVDQPYTIKDSYLNFKLGGLCIATFVIPVEEMDDFGGDLASGKYLIMPRNNNSTAVTARDGKVALQSVNLSPDQVWDVELGDNGAKFTNLNGDIITAGDGYSLSYASAAQGTQTFKVTPIDNEYYKIEAGNRAFDLESEKSDVGTGVGMWDYGTSPAASHRQFRFFPLTDRNSVTPEVGGIFDAIGQESDAVRFIPSRGMVTVEAKAAAGHLAICTLDGRIIYSAPMGVSAVDVPLAAGLYVVSYTDGQRRASKVVAIGY